MSLTSLGITQMNSTQLQRKNHLQLFTFNRPTFPLLT